MYTYTKRYNVLLFYIFLIFLFNSNVSQAAQFESDDNIHISNIHVIDGDLYTWGEKVTIDGEIKGDLNSG